jgi:hypothetical protein
MKLAYTALAIVGTAACCGTLCAQRTGDFGFGNDDAPSNVKA